MKLSKARKNVILILVSVTIALCYFVPYIRFSFYDQTLLVYHINNTQMGMLGSIYGTIAIFGYLVSGVLANKFSARALMAVSSIGTGVVTLWMAQMPDFTMLMVIFALFSVFTIATLWSPYLVILRNLGPEQEQGWIFGASDSVRNLLSCIAGFFFIWFFSLFVNAHAGYAGMLYVCAVLYFIVGIANWLVIPDFRTKKAKAEENVPKVSILSALKIPGVWLMGLFLFCCYNAITTQTNYLGTYTTQVLGMDASVSSSLAVVRTYLIPVAIGLVAGFLLDRVKSRAVSLGVVLGLLAVACIMIIFFDQTIAVPVFLSMVISTLALTLLATYWSLMGDCGIPIEYTAVATGIISCIAYVPDAYVTLIVGRWLDADPVSGFDKTFLWIAGWSVCGVILAWLIYRRKKHSLGQGQEE